MNTQPRQIMLVDDEPKLLSALRRRLSSDFDLVTFESANEALVYLKKDHNVAVIVADMQMPEMNGVELLVEVQKCAPQVRRLMLTGNSDQETAVDAINLGKVMRFIRKPCDALELKKVINHALEEYEFNLQEISMPLDGSLGSHDTDSAHSAFLSVISEEFRTPLNQIIGMTGVLSKDNNNVSREQMSEFLNQIGQSGKHLLTLVDRILQFTKLQSETWGQTEEDTFDIVGLIRQEVKNLEPIASKKLLTISVESVRKFSDVFGNEKEIALAVHELMSNAVKFNNFGGHISVMVKCSDDLVAVRISDTGEGISEELKSQLMGAFQQADNSLSRKHEGLGLGLALVGAIAEKNDLYFDINSAKSVGTTATLVFKRAGVKGCSEDVSLEKVLKAS